jgi:anti-sigma B factor antagonist
MPDVGFSVEVTGGVPVVAVPEEVDINNAAELRAALLRAAARGHGTFVIDMGRTQFCDTAGLHALVGAHKRAQAEGGRALLVLGGPTVLRVFSITGLDRVIPYFSSLEEALAQAAPGPTREPDASSSLLAAVRQDLPGLGQQAFLEHAPPVRVALQQRHGCVLGLLEGGVRRDGRDVGVGPDVQYRRPAGG